MDHTAVAPPASPTPRHDGWTAPRRAGFLDALRSSGHVRVARSAVRMAKSGAYALRRRDPAFAQAWDEALRDARPLLDDQLISRALSGTRTVYLDAEHRVVRTLCQVDTRLMLRMLSRLEHRAGLRSARRSRAGVPKWTKRT